MEKSNEIEGKWEKQIEESINNPIHGMIISKTFVEIIISVIFSIGLAASLYIFIISFQKKATLEYICAALGCFLGTCVFCCFLILGVLHIKQMEKINENLKKNKDK